MSTKTITVYQAMVELKLLKKQLGIETQGLSTVRQTSRGMTREVNVDFVALKPSNAKELAGMKIEDYSNLLKSNFDKYIHLIKNVEAYSAAIAQSNAVTKVTIAGVEYTVAEAIKKKENLPHMATLLACIKGEINAVQKKLIEMNAKVDDKWLETLKVLTNDGTIEIKEEFINSQKEEFYAKNTYEIVDPYGLVGKIDTMIEAHNAFESEVDTVLTTSNTQTMITIELED